MSQTQTDIYLPPEDTLDFDRPFDRAAERHRSSDLSQVRPDAFFVTLLGPSAVGKSEIMWRMMAMDESIAYVKPATTRQPREGETDKVYIPDRQFDELEADGGFLCVNEIYGARYGTPRQSITRILAAGQTPILDFPLARAEVLSQPDLYDLVKLYVFPPTLNQWLRRLEDSGRNTSTRIESGLAEMRELITSPSPHPQIDYSFISNEGQLDQCAREILGLIRQLRQE